jgi:hypothetical protein
LTPVQRNASFHQLSKIDRPNHQFPVETSPLQAERGFSLEPIPRKIKNPATSAGQIRPAFRGIISATPRTDELEARL